MNQRAGPVGTVPLGVAGTTRRPREGHAKATPGESLCPLTDFGEVTRARALCEKLLSLASPLLLYAEEIEAHTGRRLGNFPQAFSHRAHQGCYAPDRGRRADRRGAGRARDATARARAQRLSGAF
jgi:hypothetical protein